jgi:hypothetical protein
MKIAIVVQAADPHRQDEAMRAALGLTLRQARVEAVLPVHPDLLSPFVRRVADTLRAFGHTVAHGDAAARAAIDRADVVEVWT